MPYVSGFDRNQLMCCSWDAFVDEESIARIIDAFVEHLDMKKYGVKAAAVEGRPSYDPKSLYKLYIYGSRKGIRSSRKLAESCKVNLEVKWMTGGVEPDFRTISDFRKDNIDSLKEIFHEFNRRISGAVEWGFTSVDGTKIQANNSKDNNFTKNKLDDRIKWLNGHTDEYGTTDALDMPARRRMSPERGNSRGARLHILARDARRLPAEAARRP